MERREQVVHSVTAVYKDVRLHTCSNIDTFIFLSMQYVMPHIGAVRWLSPGADPNKEGRHGLDQGRQRAAAVAGGHWCVGRHTIVCQRNRLVLKWQPDSLVSKGRASKAMSSFLTIICLHSRWSPTSLDFHAMFLHFDLNAISRLCWQVCDADDAGGERAHDRGRRRLRRPRHRVVD